MQMFRCQKIFVVFVPEYGDDFETIGNRVLQGGHNLNDAHTLIAFLSAMQFRALNAWGEKGVTGAGKEDPRIT